MRVFAILAVLAGSVVGLSGPSASATPLCEGVSVGGTWIPTYGITQCIPYSGPVICNVEGAGFDPDAHVYTLVCIPTPIVGSSQPPTGP